MMKRRIFAVLLAVFLLLPAGMSFAFGGGRGPDGPGYGEEMDKEKMRGPMGGDEMRGGHRGERRHGGGEEGGLPRGRWWRMGDLAERLKLTAEEKETLDTLFMDNRRKMIDLKSGVEKEKLELEALLEGRQLDEQAVLAQFRKVHETKGRMGEARFGFILTVRKLLGYERFQQLKSSINERFNRAGRYDGGKQPMREGERRPEDRR